MMPPSDPNTIAEHWRVVEGYMLQTPLATGRLTM